MNYDQQMNLQKVRELLKRYQIVIYTGGLLDDLVLMDVEVDGLYEEHQIEAPEYQEMKLILRRAIREAEENA
ncbi:MAG: YqgQ family protein [Tumebacillaceae bacterium]